MCWHVYPGRSTWFGKRKKVIENRDKLKITPYLFLSKGDILHFFTKLINLKLISELVSSDNSVFLCINAIQVWRILISITLFFAHAQLQNPVNKALNEKKKRNSLRHQTRQIGGASTNRMLDVLKTWLSFSRYFSPNAFLQNTKFWNVAFFTIVQYSVKCIVHIKYCCIN